MAIRITRAGVALTVGIIVVTGLIIGGLFLAKNQGEQARRDDAIRIAEQNLEEQSSEGVSLGGGESNTETTQSEESTESAGEGSTSTESSSEAASGDVASTSAAEELPATGPADVTALLVIGLITFAGVSYFRSRRALLAANF